MRKIDWVKPELTVLEVSETMFNPAGGTIEDGSYRSYDGVFNIPTYGNSESEGIGQPHVDVN